MSIRTAFTRHVHDILCGPTPRDGDPCVSCPNPADAYITIGCDHCRAAGEPYCWACIDGWPATAPVHITAADVTVIPGRER